MREEKKIMKHKKETTESNLQTCRAAVFLFIIALMIVLFNYSTYFNNENKYQDCFHSQNFTRTILAKLSTHHCDSTLLISSNNADELMAAE